MSYKGTQNPCNSRLKTLFFEIINKKNAISFVVSEICCTFAPANKKLQAILSNIGVWCNGNTADSGPAFPGSNPGTPTTSR